MEQNKDRKMNLFSQIRSLTMDIDLLLDVFRFLPEKYFITRLLNKASSFSTRISFVDYERSHYKYMCINEEQSFWYPRKWWEYKDGSNHQEYGPAFESEFMIFYLRRGMTHRKNGPAVIFKQNNSWLAKAFKARSHKIIYHYCNEEICLHKGEDRLVTLKNIWVENGIPIKCHGNTTENLEVIAGIDLPSLDDIFL